MKCKEKEDLIEIRVIIIKIVIIIIIIIISFIIKITIVILIITTMISVCKTRTDCYASESTCLRRRATSWQTS